MKKRLYPLIFNPILQKRVWGGRRLIEELAKVSDEDSGEAIGESWEIAALDEDNSTAVREGYLAGNTLDELLQVYLGELVGDAVFDCFNCYFPLLVKFLDVNGNLSIQVHPDDATALERYECYGKEECWYVVEASEDARIYMGFKRETTAEEFYNACLAGNVIELMNVCIPRTGDFFHIPAGTVHACGGGVLLAEVQQASDITFRLYDWGRENNPATARQMHLEEAIDCIDYHRYDFEKFFKRAGGESGPLADTPHFSVSRLRLDGTYHIYPEHFKSCIVYICVEGCAELRWGEEQSERVTLPRGGTVLVPASMDDFFIAPLEKGTTLLEASIPESDAEEDGYIDDEDGSGCGCGHERGHGHGHSGHGSEHLS